MRLRVKAWLSIVVAGLAATLPAGPTPAQTTASTSKNTGAPRAIIVLDASGSMLAPVGGRPKVEVARDALSDLLKGWDPKVEVGLMAYGHRRKGDCADIEVLSPAGKIDASRLMGIVGGIHPKGMTPLSEAVKQAAQSLSFTEQAATVILISDGIETCKADPCAMGAELKKLGVDFRTHVIGFDVQRQDEGGLRCLANATGGKYFSAKDAGALREALKEAGREAAAPPPAPTPNPMAGAPKAPLPKATLKGPMSVTAGDSLTVDWTGPNAKGDHIAFVLPGAEGTSGNMTETAAGNPAPLRAPDKTGRYDIVYGNAEGKVLARQPIDVTPAKATLEAVETITLGGTVDVGWTGPSGNGDFITIVPSDAGKSVYRDYAHTRDGNPAKVRVPDKAGTYEIRYVTGDSDQVLARRTVVALPAQVDLQAVDSAPAGSRIKVKWTGPNNAGDFITVVKPGDTKTAYTDYFNAKGADSDEQTLKLPGRPGTYELRYVTGQSNEVLARKTITVVATTATLSAPDSAPAGARVAIQWTGPNNDGDFITVVRPDQERSAYGEYFNTKSTEPDDGKLIVPARPGTYELRYVGADNQILARRAITTTPLEITLEAPDTVRAGKSFDVKWSGPRIPGNFLTVVTTDRDPEAYDETAAVDGDDEVQLRAPEEPGKYELRYVVPSTKKVLAKKTIVVK